MKLIITENQKERMLRNLIKNNGVEFASNMIGGIEILFDILKIRRPMDFLHLFDNLKPFRSKEYPNWLLFLNESNDNLIAYKMNSEISYINSELVWFFLRYYFGISYQEIQELTKSWLSESYNLTVIQTHSGSQDFMESLIP